MDVLFLAFDWQVVYGVHPKNAEFIIAPDIVNQQVKMSRDDGATWVTNWYLTLAATQAGKYLLWDKRESRVQVTHISYDPYNDDRILVGTRDAGVICTRDGGVTWRTIKGTGSIRYITGFQFRPDGDVLVSSYGRGPWRIKRKRTACTEGKEWLLLPPAVEIIPWEDYRTGQVALRDPDEGSKSQPTGVDIPNVPVLIGQGEPITAEDIILGADNMLTVSGRGFDGKSGSALVAYLNGEKQAYKRLGPPNKDGTFSVEIAVPDNLPYGEHRLEIRQQGTASSSIWFRKVHLDEHLGEEGAVSQFRDGNAWEAASRRLYEKLKQSSELEKIK